MPPHNKISVSSMAEPTVADNQVVCQGTDIIPDSQSQLQDPWWKDVCVQWCSMDMHQGHADNCIDLLRLLACHDTAHKVRCADKGESEMWPIVGCHAVQAISPGSLLRQHLLISNSSSRLTLLIAFWKESYQILVHLTSSCKAFYVVKLQNSNVRMYWQMNTQVYSS